jgi:hypothetical protein
MKKIDLEASVRKSIENLSQAGETEAPTLDELEDRDLVLLLGTYWALEEHLDGRLLADLRKECVKRGARYLREMMEKEDLIVWKDEEERHE